MGKQQKKFEKKKAREKAVQTKIRTRREAKQKKERELRQEAQALDAVNKLVKKRVDLEQWAKEVEGKIPPDTHAQIQKNIEILKALEEEYAQELKQKVELQDRLHDQGHHTLPDMLEALQTQTADEQKAAHEAGESVFDETGAGAVYSDSSVSLTMNTGLSE